MTKTLLTRKDLAAMLGVSVWVIRNNEDLLELRQFRARINSRMIMYQGWRVIPHLTRRGLLAE
jgi:hypothetical protein